MEMKTKEAEKGSGNHRKYRKRGTPRKGSNRDKHRGTKRESKEGIMEG